MKRKELGGDAEVKSKRSEASSSPLVASWYRLSDIWLWAESSPIVLSWIKLHGSSTDESDDENAFSK